MDGKEEMVMRLRNDLVKIAMDRQGKSLCLVLAGTFAVSGMATLAFAERASREAPNSVVQSVEYAPNPELEGRLAIAGSTTMRPLLLRLAVEFRQLHPRVSIAVESAGSSEAIREFSLGISGQRRGDKAKGDSGHDGAAQVDILASSRELTMDERGRFVSRFGYEPLAIPIALDAVAIYVHKTNPVQGLTLTQLDSIFSSTRNRGGQDITTWGQLGLEGMTDKPIHLYGRDKRSGTHDFFQSVALDGGQVKASVDEEPGSASEILAIARDPLAIGYAGVGFEISEIRVVPLAAESGKSAILPNADSVADRSYPLSRTLYLYVNHDRKSKFDPVILEFLTYVNSQAGQQAVVRAKAYPLPEGMIGKNLEVLNGATRTAFSPRLGAIR
ncbi:MAG: phosphate ABC transporter substrate-binding protein [Nitrospira sp. CR1.3]|nr:phosphate ABC transporter substrate-binding protein [Nitrospira sp. CR1.3]